MKTKILLCTIASLLLLNSAFSQSKTKAQKPLLLTTPTDWRYEKVKLPLEFAPEMTYTGFEELRFSPGMFDVNSPNHFTYLFAVSINNTPKLAKEEVITFLSQYYKGLLSNVAKSSNLKVDTDKITVTLDESKKAKGKHFYANATIFDSFTDGRELTLHLDLEIISDKQTKKSYILAFVSPQDMESEVWKNLYEIKNELKPQLLLITTGKQ